MKKTEVRNLIYSGLKPVLSENGFSLKKSPDGFVRPISEGRQYVGIPLWDYNPVFEFSVVAAIRINKIEDISNRFSGSPAKYHAMTETVTFRAEHFMPKESATFKVTTENEIRTSVNQLMLVVRNQIIPFLNQHQDLKSVAEAMNLAEIRKCVVGFADACDPVIVARLTNNPHYQAIVEGYRQRLDLVRFPKPELEKFEKLVEHLEKL